VKPELGAGVAHAYPVMTKCHGKHARVAAVR